MTFQVPDIDAAAKMSERSRRLYDKLARRGENMIFDQMTALYTLTAAIGVRTGRKDPIKEKSDRVLKWQWFNSETEHPVMAALAWKVQNHDKAVLATARTILDALEEYAEGGMRLLEEKVLNPYIDDDGHLHPPTGHELEIDLLAEVKKLAKQDNPFETAAF